MRDYKKDELDKIKADRAAADGVYMGMSSLQALIKQAKDFREEIELFIVEKEFLGINIEELDKTADELMEKKDDLEEKKKKMENQNEELEK